MASVEFPAEARHDGLSHQFMIAEFPIPCFSPCGENVFTNVVDQQVNGAFHPHPQLLT
jgi:hypothetical protein